MKSKQALSLLEVHRRTLSRYVGSGKIRAIRLPNGTLNYNEDDVYKLSGKSKVRMNVIYARVSTDKQKQDLQNQIDTIERFMNSKGIKVDKIYKDIKTGMHLDRNGFMMLLSDLQDGLVDRIFISYKDRLARLSYGLAEKLITQNHGRIELINKADKTDEQELFEDLMQVIDSFSMTMSSRRRLAKKIGEKENAKS